MRRGAAAVAAAVTLLLGGAPVGTVASGQPRVTFHDEIAGYTFTLGFPSRTAGTLHIRPGDSVVWTNQDPVSHNVSFSVAACNGCVPFFAYLPPGTSARLTFQRPGYYRFVCSEHPTYRGMYGAYWVDPKARV